MEKATNDHDLLIKIATLVDRLILDVKDIATNTVGRVEKLEMDKADECVVEKLKERVIKLENWRWYIV